MMKEQLSKRTADADRRVGAGVRAARVSAGFSQSKLAGELGITFQQLQKYEKGKNRIAVSTLMLIAEALDLPAQSFLDPVERSTSGDSDWPDFLTKENLRLLRAYSQIADVEIRRRIFNLIVEVNEGEREVDAKDGDPSPHPAASARVPGVVS